jgi:hypothetical protein
MKKVIIAIIVIALVGVGLYFLLSSTSNKEVIFNNQNISTSTVQVGENATTTKPENKSETVIGKSVKGLDITAYHYGVGETEILFIGGIHGGYEWNTVLLAYEMMDYLKANPSAISANERITVIPVLNPDGLNKTVGTAGRFTLADVPASSAATVAGRFNADNVDLNRNFDCNWQTSGTWQNKTVSGGSSAFSEPESQALKVYVEANKPSAVVAFYSAAGGVYSSSCNNGVSANTRTLTNTYAKASGYPAYEEFTSYETTGDMTNWLAKINIPTISVLLTNHTDTEWTKNLAGIKAVLKSYSK